MSNDLEMVFAMLRLKLKVNWIAHITYDDDEDDIMWQMNDYIQRIYLFPTIVHRDRLFFCCSLNSTPFQIETHTQTQMT